MKKTILITLASLLLMGCAETVESITLSNGQKGKEMSMYVMDDKDNYLSELYLLRKAQMFTYVKMKTSPSSDALYVNIRRLHLNKSKVMVYPFTINDIKPSKCTYEDKGKYGFTRECKFSKNRIYNSFKKYNKLTVDESGNGKKSASVECVKEYPNVKDFTEQRKIERCIENVFKLPHQTGSVALRLGTRELTFTNKHYQINVKDQALFKQFIF